MFIKTIVKTAPGTKKRYDYYRLCEGYRIEGKVRHRTILSLGNLEGLPRKKHKALADAIESLLAGQQPLFAHEDSQLAAYAQDFANRIIRENLVDTTVTETTTKPSSADYIPVDINSLSSEDARQIGCEHICYQALKQLGIPQLLTAQNWTGSEIKTALVAWISRAVFPASEHKTAQWVQTNSAVAELVGIPPHKVSRHQLYSVARKLYDNKETIEKHLSHTTSELFDLQDKIMLYDLTNTYFEGRKENSQLAAFGRSKEKRSDAKLVVLGLVTNPEGFIKHSKYYPGNTADPTTLKDIVDDLDTKSNHTGRKPIVAIDAGIATEDNLAMLRKKGYDYICVSRSKLKDYQQAVTETMTIKDKRGNNIVIKKLRPDTDGDTWLYVKSTQKAKKEAGIYEKLCGRFELGLQNIGEALTKKRGTKKLEKVHQRIGRLKQKYPRVQKLYSIHTQADEKNIVTELKWEKKPREVQPDEGVYFIRTTLHENDEATLWRIYGTLTEIEATFRILKTDLHLRPVHHQKDINTQAHLHLATLAYTLVHTIRYQLKINGIHDDWKNITRKMSTHQILTTSLKAGNGDTIFIRHCTKPDAWATNIYKLLKVPPCPIPKRKSVVPQNQTLKN